MKDFIKSLQKRGQANVDKKMTALIGAVIVIFLVTQLAPEMFSQIENMSNSSAVPGWVPAVLFVIVGAGIVFLIWNTFN